MNHWLKKNLESLQRLHPEAFKKAMEHLDQNRPYQLPVETDPQGHLNLRMGDGWFYSHDLEADMAKNRANIDQLTSSQLVVWFGLGLGHHLKSVFQNELHHFVIVEPSLEFFLTWLSIEDQTALLQASHVHFFIGVQPDDTEAELKSFLPTVSAQLKNQIFVEFGFAHPYFETFKSKWHQWAAFFLERTMIHMLDSYYGWMNFWENRETVKASPFLSDFRDMFAGRPGVIVSSGPSLTLSLPALQKIAHRVVIFAASSALGILEKNGIRPHFTACLERDIAMHRTFKNVGTKRTALVATPINHPTVFQTHQGPVILMNRPHHFLPWLYPEKPVEGGVMSSVTHMGVKILKTLGCNEIYFFGQDLSYDPQSSHSHSAGYIHSIDKNSMENWGIRTVEADSNSGGIIRTTTTWHDFAIALEAQVSDLSIRAINVIPQTHGMKLSGFERTDPDSLNLSADKQPLAVFEMVQAQHEKLVKSQAHQTSQKNRDEIIRQSRDQLSKWIKNFNERIISLLALENRTNEEQTALLQQIEMTSRNELHSPLWDNMLSHVCVGRLAGIFQANTIVGQISSTPAEKTAMMKSLLIDWLSEITVKARLVLNHLKN